MGKLNWAAGLENTSQGLDRLGLAMEKTDELEYRNIRDANLRRFQLEDQMHDDVRESKKWQREDDRNAVTDARADEDKGIVPETDRGKKILEREEEKRAQKQKDDLERIAANIKGRYASKVKPGQTRAEYIQEKMKEMYDKYAEQQGIDLTQPATGDEEGNNVVSRMMPAADRDLWILRWGADYDAFSSAGGDKVPFAEEDEDAPQDDDQDAVVNWSDL